MRLSVGLVENGARRDVTVVLPATATIDELARLLNPHAPDTTLYAGPVPLEPTARLVDAGLREGALLAVGAPAPDESVPQANLEIAVVGGPFAGVSHPLAEGKCLIGREADCDLRLADPEVSRHHAVVSVAEDGSLEIWDKPSTNGVFVDGRRIDRSHVLRPGQIVRLGRSELTVRRPETDLAHVAPDGPARLAVNRPRRDALAADPPSLRVPEPARRAEKSPFEWWQIAIPIVVAAVIVVWTRNLLYVAFSGASVAMILANLISTRSRARRDTKSEAQRFADEEQAFRAALTEALAADMAARRRNEPDLAALARIAAGPLRRLWERRLIGDDGAPDRDFLHVRVGTADLPIRADFVVPDGVEFSPPQAPRVPISVDLRAAGALGIAGERDWALSSARAAVCSLVVLHSPRDVRLVVVTDESQSAEWDFVKWLPHARRAGPGRETAIASTHEAVGREVDSLSNLVRSREPARPDAPGGGHAVVLVVDGTSHLQSVPGLPALLRSGPQAGVHVIMLAETEKALPSECRAQLIAPGFFDDARLRLPGDEIVTGVLPDGAPVAVADRIARSLSGLSEARVAEAGAVDLPREVPYLAMLGRDASIDAVVARWTGPDRGVPRAPLGMASGEVLAVDLRGKGGGQGPHALVGGATGFGKSEALRTLLISLALANPPTHCAFVIFDFKLGQGLKQLEALPHTAALVTDAHPATVVRAVRSLEAEFNRRQGLINDSPAEDFEEYWEGGFGDEPMPRLFIVVDEFADFKESVPGAFDDLVRIVRKGRTAGMHLILGTQTLSENIAGDISNNSQLRICLYVPNPAESQEVIGSPLAAHLDSSIRGRGYVRAGSKLAEVQFGWTGAHSSTELAVDDRPAVLDFVAGSAADRVGDHAAGGLANDLDQAISTIERAARQLDLGRARQPWLDPLPDAVPASELALHAGLGPAEVVLGREDRPAQLEQEPLVHDFGAHGNLLIVGGAQAGKTGTLLGIASSIAHSRAARDAHLYAIDYGGTDLGALEALPHCGAVVGADDPDRFRRLVQVVAGIIRDRERAERRAPPTFVLIDRFDALWDQVAAESQEALMAEIADVVRRGPSAGVFILMTVDVAGAQTKVPRSIRSRLILPLPDRSDYSAVGGSAEAAPADTPGRATVVPGGTHVQVAMAGAAPTREAARAAFERIATAETSPADGLPAAVPPLPRDLLLASLPTGQLGPLEVMLGRGGPTMQPTSLDLAATKGGLAVSGRVGTGKTAVLRLIATQLGDGRSGRPRVVLVTMDRADGLPASCLVVAPTDRDRLRELNAADEPTVWLIDDADGGAVQEADAELNEVWAQVARRGSVMVASGRAEGLIRRYSPWAEGVLATGSVLLLLGPQARQDASIHGLQLRPGLVRLGDVPGRAVLAHRGSVDLVVVAQA